MPRQPENPIPPYIHEHIDAIIEAEQAAHRSRSWSEVVYDWVGGFIGTLSFVVVQVLGTVLWVRSTLASRRRSALSILSRSPSLA